MKRVVLLSLTTAFLAACQDTNLQSPEVGDVSAIVVDASHNDGNGAFHWLSPSANPNSSNFGTFDATVRPTIEICPLESGPGPGGMVCETDNGGNRVVVQRFTPSEIDGASDHYHVKFDTKKVQRGLYRMIASIGSTDDGHIVLAELGIRDVGIGKNVGCTTNADDAILCISGEHQIKFRVDEDAICFDGPVLLGDTCAGGTLTSGGPQSFVLSSGGGVQGATPSGTELSLVFTEVACEQAGERVLGLEDGSGFHAMQWALYAPCFKVTTSPVITSDNISTLLEGGLLAYEICFDHPAGMSAAQKGQARLARMATDRSELQVLDRDPSVDVVGGCPEELAAGFGAKLWNLARGFFRDLPDPFAPKALHAATGFMRRSDFGVGGLGPKSFVGVVIPATLSAGTVDLGVRSSGETIAVEVTAEDDATDAVENNQVSFAAEAGDTFDGGSGATVVSGADGSAGGDWVVNGGGTHTLTATCFPCGGTDAPVTGDDLTDGAAEYDDLAYPGNNQTITFTAVVLDLSVAIPGGQGRLLVNVDFNLEICIGADIEGVEVALVGRANNGTPTEVVPSVAVSPDPTEFDSPGCWIEPIHVTKTGGIRIIATLLDGSGAAVETEETPKVNIRPK